MAIIIGDRIQNNATDSTLNPVPNLDLYYGPYDNIEEALKFLPQKVRSIGLTVGIKRKGVINEYWFKEGIQNTDLVVKQLDFTDKINQLETSIQTAKEHLDDFKVVTDQKNTGLDNKINSSILDVNNKLSTLETELKQKDIRVDDKIDGVQARIGNLSQMITRKSYTSQSTMNEDGVAPIGDDGTLILLGQLVILNDTTTPENNGLYRFTNPGWAFVGNLGNLEPYALKGGSSKTLKEVDDEIAQLAGDVEQLAYVKIKNEVVNGNFENGLIAPFSKSDGQGGASTLDINNSTPISGNYDIRLTIITPGGGARPTFSGLGRAANIGDKIYLHFYAKILSGIPIIGAIQDGSTTNTIYRGDVINGRNTRIIDAKGTSNSLGVIYFNSSSIWDMQMDNFMRINLTETFGAGNEPTEEEMDLLISTLGIDYFEGEITIPAQKVMQWQLKLIRKNKNAIIALGGTII